MERSPSDRRSRSTSFFFFLQAVRARLMLYGLIFPSSFSIHHHHLRKLPVLLRIHLPYDERVKIFNRMVTIGEIFLKDINTWQSTVLLLLVLLTKGPQVLALFYLITLVKLFYLLKLNLIRSFLLLGILFYFILFYFILFYFNLFYFILFYFTFIFNIIFKLGG